jgi:hypothetical protein
VLGKFAGEDESDAEYNVRKSTPCELNVENLRSLNLSGADGGLLVVGSELGGFGGNALEDI